MMQYNDFDKLPDPSLKNTKVGVFWVFHSKLCKSDSYLGNGVEDEIAINGPLDHVSCWPALQREDPELLPFEYEQVPRGRVVFLKSAGKFCVYMDKRLHTVKTRRRILEAFNLPKGKTEFHVDAHYTTDPAALDRLFNDDSK